MRPFKRLAFCCGLFVVAGQASLLRECLATLAGGDVWIGPILAAWFVGVAVGARGFRRIYNLGRRLAGAVEVLVLAYVPVLCLQYFGIVLFVWTGADVPMILPLHHVLGWSLLIAVPGGLLTGLVFAALCRRAGECDASPISAVCLWISTGGVVGGLVAAVLPYAGLTTIRVFLVVAATVCGFVLWSMRSGVWTKPRWIGRAIQVGCLAALIVAVLPGTGASLSRVQQNMQWGRAVPSGVLEGGFSTSQAEYLYGADDDRWVVVRGGSVCEVVGDRAAAGRIAAMALSQNFTAQRILVVGDGFSVCERFLKSPKVETVDWFHPERGYASSLLAHLPQTHRISDARLHVLTEDLRATLAGRPGAYDVVVVNLPGVVDGTLHRFASVEFFEQVKRSLRPVGVVVTGVAGDRNVPGGEPSYQGAWMESTLEAVFAQTLLTPAEDRTFFVSAAGVYLQVSPIMLETRFGLLENADDIFPVESMSSVYRTDVALRLIDSYAAVDLPTGRLTNRDDRPSYFLCSVLQAMHRSGLSLVKPVRSILRGGLIIVLIPIGLFGLMRVAYTIRTAPRAKGCLGPQCGPALRSDVLLLTGCVGVANMAVLVLSSHAWQTVGGSLSLHVGLLFSLFALGLAVGTLCSRWAVSRLRPQASLQLRTVLVTLAVLLGVHAGGLAVLGFAVERVVTWPVLATLLSGSGFLGGTGLVLVTKILEGCHIEPRSAAACLTGAKSLGAATGACLAGLFLIPLLGLQAAFYITAAFVLANAACAGAAQYELSRPGIRVVSHRLLSPAGYGLLGIALCAVAGSHLLAYQERSQANSQATVAIQDWIQGRKVSARTVTSPITSKQATYHEVRESSQLRGYIFRSEDFSGKVYGYGGPMSVILFADPAGMLVDFRITRSYETPRYISRIRSWMASLKGKKVFGPNPMQGINSVSGATLSCDAILRLLRNSGRQFDASVFVGGQVAQAAERDWIQAIDWLAVQWGAGIALALVAIWHGRLWSRVTVLIYAAAVGGFWLNRQYSTDHVIRLLSGQNLLGSSISGVCLLLGVPIVILLLGNIYCGYLCPFGAVQELVGLIIPKRFKARLSLSTITAGRFVKYGLLFVLVAVFFVTGSKRLLELDPLTLFFNRQLWVEGFPAFPALILGVLVLVIALVVTRAWCRYLCPTGAFLSLFNLAGWLGRFLPAKKFGRCEFGLRGRDHLDCIHCDRCRYESQLLPTRDDVIARTAPQPQILSSAPEGSA